MYQVCIFDLDGTIADTLESLNFSTNMVLEELGLASVSMEQSRMFVGNGAKNQIRCALMAAGDPDCTMIDRAMEAYGRIFGSNCIYHVQPYDGINEMLKELRDRGVTLAVLSNKPHEQAVKVVEEVFGREVFTLVQGQQEHIPRKPNPAGVYDVLAQLNAANDKCVYVGDSDVDIVTGTAAGVKTIGVTWGFRSAEELSEAGAKTLIGHPRELLYYFETKQGKEA